LRDAGFGDIEHIALDDWATRDDLGAGEVVSVQDAGQNRDTGQPIGVATNPSTKPAPIAAPPDIDEDTANPCDLNPGGTHSDPAAAHEHGVFDVFDDGYPIASPRGTADTFLPWGATWLAGTNWAGFGYSKILAKHGWTPDDAAQTRAVLAEPQHSYVRQGNGRDRYLGLAKLISRSGPSRRPVDRSSVSAPSLSSRTTLALSRVRAMARPTFNRQARIRPASGPRSAPGRGTACDR
jgi:hypothetical protein